MSDHLVVPDTLSSIDIYGYDGFSVEIVSGAGASVPVIGGGFQRQVDMP